MYISTTFYPGDTVYFTDTGDCVIRATVVEVCVTQDKTSTHTRYLLTCGIYEVTRNEDALHRSADAALRAWDREHPIDVEYQTEPAAA